MVFVFVWLTSLSMIISRSNNHFLTLPWGPQSRQAKPSQAQLWGSQCPMVENEVRQQWEVFLVKANSWYQASEIQQGALAPTQTSPDRTRRLLVLVCTGRQLLPQVLLLSQVCLLSFPGAYKLKWMELGADQETIKGMAISQTWRLGCFLPECLRHLNNCCLHLQHGQTMSLHFYARGGQGRVVVMALS